MTNIVRPSILPGFMELLPEDQILFDRMKEIVEEKFQKFAFLPIETPVIEKSEILFAKGGGETQKQIYKIESKSTDMSMRFDLTVPLARYVAQYFSQLQFPFRRYQIGKVYRGERNQRGRFREFYQADIDIIGHERLSLYNDAEIPAVIYEVFQALNFTDMTFHVNNRKLMNGYFASLGVEDTVGTLRSIDKLAKIGVDQVKEELFEIGLSPEDADRIINFISFEGSNEEKLQMLQALEVLNPIFIEGREELVEVYGLMKDFGVPESNILIDLSITRGLDYYTGTVFETFLDGYESIGSVCSGGRYDDLAGNYTKQKLPGIGLSIGLTRLFYQLKEADLIRFEAKPAIEALIIPMKGCEDYGIQVLQKLRAQGKRVQIYLEGGKMKKMFAYADKLAIPKVIIAGESERDKGAVSVRDMKTGDQVEILVDDLI